MRRLNKLDRQIRRRRPLGQGGFTYPILLFTIVLMGITLMVVGRQWKMVVQRELEADLLARGLEIQNALALYSASKKAGRVIPGEIYPQSLKELTLLPKPFLRKVYLDPVQRAAWDIIRAPNGGIMGVRSSSSQEPIRQHGFPAAIRHFEGMVRYQDWLFVHPSPSLQQAVPAIPPVN